MTEKLLQVEGLDVRFAGNVALDRVSLDVAAGEVVALIGPNGAGKTTLFNAVSGHVKPSGGAIRFRGARIEGLPPHRVAERGIRRTFQNGGLFGEMTVLENVLAGFHSRTESGFFGLLFGGRSAREAERAVLHRARDLLESLEIGHLADRKTRNLSVGQQRMAELARTVAAEPPLILLDEPAVGLSPTARATLVALIHRLVRERGIGILLIEHAIEMVMDLSDRVAVLASGQKIAEGKPEAVRHDKIVLEAYLGHA